ncbi:MAG: ABC transporter permease [Bryobacteraceae bacterium]|jgi:macrolide transport system ATP-binding/permease protein
MAPKFPWPIVLLFRLRFRRSAESALGDLMEEWSAGNGSPRWLWRQAVSMLWPGTGGSHVAYPQKENDMNMLSTFWSDLRYAARTLRKNPGFTTVAVLAISLGIGVNTGIFTVLNGVALRPLPLPGASDIVSVYQSIRGLKSRNVHGAPSFFSWPEYKSYRDDNHVLSGLAAYSPFLAVTLGGQQPQQLFGQLASCNYFEVLNEPPALGRAFSASDCAVAHEGAVVVLSDNLWRTTFAADPAIVGTSIVLNRQPFMVIGVAPAGFQGTEPIPAAFWAPVTMQALLERGTDWFEEPNMSWLVLLGRTKSGVSRSQVRADMAVIAGRIDQLTPGRKTKLQIETGTFLSMPEARKYITIVGVVLLAAVGMVLLIACANVANLLLARAASRQKEIAIRLSVGASRGRLIRQLLTESMLIALLGGALGSLIAVWSFEAIMDFILSHLPHGTPPLAVGVGPDIRVLGYALLLTLITGIVFGLVPAWQASRPDVNTALKQSGIGGKSADGFLRHALVGTQVAVSMVLLIAAGLLLRGLYQAQTIDPGFEMKNVAVVSFDLRGQGYDDARAGLFQRQALDRLAALPGVDTVAEAGNSPLSDSHRGTVFSLPGQPGDYQVELNEVSPEFFSLLGIPIVRGRNLTGTEARTGAPVTIVTESTARRFWPNQDPIGKIVRMDDKSDMQVIGVAKDAQVSHLARSNETFLYLPAGPKQQVRMQLLVHGVDGFASMAAGIRAAIHSIDPGLVVDVARLEDNLEFWRGPSRIAAILAGALGALGMLLACVGVYGVVSYAVSRRVREIGIRMTLGADAHEVRSLILRQAMRPVAIGALVGIAGCAAVSQILSGMLFGLSSHDPVAFVVVPLVLLSVALAASYIPARRATQVDPMIALRYE